jgi:hypothetical protein
MTQDIFRFIICILFFILSAVLLKDKKWSIEKPIAILIFIMGLVYLYISVTTCDYFRFVIACLHFTLSGLLFWNPKFLQEGE